MASKLVSMKITKAARDKRMEPSSMATDAPAYPWGLSINLDTDSLKKLDLDVDDLKVGTSLSLMAKVEVTNLSSHESKGGGADQSVGLQITDLCVTGDKETKADAAKELYDK